ncbi:MAG: hypothetical protein ACREHV_04730, partial [Rhizomicrobium sp.]
MFVRFFRDRRGNFTVLSAILITSFAGIAGLVADYGDGLYQRLQDQRVADIAAVAGARVYDETQSPSAVSTAVTNIAAINGVSSGSIAESIVSSPTGDGNEAVEITVRSHAQRYFSQLLVGPTASYIPVSAASYAEMKPGGAGCIIALSSSGTGVTVSGGATASAASCAVASNQSVNCHSSTNRVTTQYVYYDASALNCGSASPYTNWIVPPTGDSLTTTKAYTTDPLAGTSEVLGQTGRLSTVEAIASPSSPTIPSGTALAFTSKSNTTLTN